MSDFAERLAAIIEVWIPPTAAELLSVSHVLAPKDTGRFAASLYSRTSHSIFDTEIEIHSDDTKPRAIWLRDGTSPHMIFGHPTLAFPQNGVTIFRANVHHPGTHPDDWGNRVLDIVGPHRLAALAAAIDVP